VTIENKRISLITIYCPNEDSPVFYQNMSDTLTKLNNKEMIIVGDFNLVLDKERDYYNYLHINNPKVREKVLELIDYFNLIDVCREFHPDVNKYTWRKPTPLKQARLDFFLASESLLPDVLNCNILTSYRSDHSPNLKTK
jgi:exonuclease III